MTPRMAPFLGERGKTAAPPPDGHLILDHDPTGVVTVTLNRPGDYNALSTAMIRDLLDALDQIGQDETAKVVVLGAAGSNFCCGIDHAELRTGRGGEGSARETDGSARFYRLLARLMVAIAQMPQPVIAKVRGLAASEGCQLVAGCDLAIAGRSARFALPDLDAGLACALPLVAISRAVGAKKALDMALTGTVVPAMDALEMGLVNRLVEDYELDAACADMALRIARRPGKAVADSKQAYHRQADLPLQEAYEAACEVVLRTAKSRDKVKLRSDFQARRLAG